MGHVCTKKALEDLIKLDPSLVAGVGKLTDLKDQLSRGLRTLLCWYGEFYKGGDVRRAVLNKATPGQANKLHEVCQFLDLRQKFEVPEVKVEEAELQSAVIEATRSECHLKIGQLLQE